jgi:hypothetical protein
MKKGDLRRFKDVERARAPALTRAGRTFMVLREDTGVGVDILIDGRVEHDLGYFWVMDSSEVISEAG